MRPPPVSLPSSASFTRIIDREKAAKCVLSRDSAFPHEYNKDVADLLRPGDWVTSINLKDAYFHVPIHSDSRKYLHFGWNQKLYQFCVLPFDLSPAPLVFTRLTKPIQSLLHRRGIRSILYFDDILIVASTKEECDKFVRETLNLLQALGFVINFFGGRTTPQPCPTFVEKVARYLSISSK